MPQPEQGNVTTELLEELERLSAIARQTLHRMANGHAVNGAAGLQKIRDQAADAARRGRQDLQLEEGATA